MENFDFELLNSLMNVYLALGIMMIIFIVIGSGFVIGKSLAKFFQSQEDENEKRKLIETKEIVKDVVEEYWRLHK